MNLHWCVTYRYLQPYFLNDSVLTDNSYLAVPIGQDIIWQKQVSFPWFGFLVVKAVVSSSQASFSMSAIHDGYWRLPRPKAADLGQWPQPQCQLKVRRLLASWRPGQWCPPHPPSLPVCERLSFHTLLLPCRPPAPSAEIAVTAFSSLTPTLSLQSLFLYSSECAFKILSF